MESYEVFAVLANPLVIKFLQGIKKGYKYGGKANKDKRIRDYMSGVSDYNYRKIKDQMLRAGLIERVGFIANCYFRIKPSKLVKWRNIL